jgi:hypothetical protein
MPIPVSTYMIAKTATSLQCSSEFQVCQATTPSAMNGTTVIVPVRKRSRRSFSHGSMSRGVGRRGVLMEGLSVAIRGP